MTQPAEPVDLTPDDADVAEDVQASEDHALGRGGELVDGQPPRHEHVAYGLAGRRGHIRVERHGGKVVHVARGDDVGVLPQRGDGSAVHQHGALVDARVEDGRGQGGLAEVEGPRPAHRHDGDERLQEGVRPDVHAVEPLEAQVPIRDDGQRKISM